jgi:large subunit ribosomal protein L11
MAKAKEIVGEIKLVIPGGGATPAPPVGPALGAKGVNIGAFVKQFNDATASLKGETIPVVITVFKDKTFTFVLK